MDPEGCVKRQLLLDYCLVLSDVGALGLDMRGSKNGFQTFWDTHFDSRDPATYELQSL